MSDPSDGAPDDDTLDDAGEDVRAALPEADLQYPTIEFEDGEIDPDGGFDLTKSTDWGEMSDVATDLAGALSSHDLGVETPERFTTLGVAPESVEMSFDPDADQGGELEVTFRLSAKTMVLGGDSKERVGARGGKGFVPLSVLTDDEGRRCYGWIDDPGDPD